MFGERTSVGLDVHARSVVACGLDTVTVELFRARLCPDHGEIPRWLTSLPVPIAVAYEAGLTGFGLARALQSAGLRCVVVAPSKLQRPVGDRVKTDPKDALHLARSLRMDELASVRVPSATEEAARDLARAREDVRGDVMRAQRRRPGAGVTEMDVGSRRQRPSHEEGAYVRVEEDNARRAVARGDRRGVCRRPGSVWDDRAGGPAGCAVVVADRAGGRGHRVFGQAALRAC